MKPVGWLGNVLLALCSLPLAWQAYRNGNTDVSLLFLWTWLLGELCAFAYALSLTGGLPIALNCAINIFGTSVVMRYRLRPRVRKEQKCTKATKSQ